MNNKIYVLLLLFSVFISAVSQILLKKSALERHTSWIREYLNIKVISLFPQTLIKGGICFMIEPPRRVDDGDSQTKKIIVFFSWNFLLHRCPSDF